MKCALRFLFLILALAACAGAQTYTYQIKLEANGRTGSPFSRLLIVGAKGYLSGGGSGSPGLYLAQLTGVHLMTRCCTPEAAVVTDLSGNLYGEDTSATAPNGRIFMLNTRAQETDLYDFTGGADGRVHGMSPPQLLFQSPVTLDSSGNIWGMTYSGGSFTCSADGGFQEGCGVVFKLTNNNGAWSEQVIHAFSGPPDGGSPEGGLTFDPLSGNYYGTTQFGGDSVCNCGTVFQLSPDGNDNWTETVLYTFTTPGTPNGGVIFDSQGNLYGTNFGDLSRQYGYAYEISQGQFSILYQFQGFPDVQNPNGPLLLDANGNLLGTSYQGGTFSGNRQGLGTVFELSPTQDGWQETTIHSFAWKNQRPTDGKLPNSGLAMDDNGNLWGSTPLGGAGGLGVFFEVTK